MEIQLKELIEQIKKDGVETAEKEAARIIDEAKNEAERIVADAKAEASKLLASAKEENDRAVRVGEEALRQAGRNVLLTFRESVARELDAVIGCAVDETLSSKTAAELIAQVVCAWSSRPEVEDIAVLLNEDDAKALEASLLAALGAHMKKGVTLKTGSAFDGGFRIAVNDGNAYYDYSADAITDMMSAYLSPKVTSLLKEASRA